MGKETIISSLTPKTELVSAMDRVVEEIPFNPSFFLEPIYWVKRQWIHLS